MSRKLLFTFFAEDGSKDESNCTIKLYVGKGGAREGGKVKRGTSCNMRFECRNHNRTYSLDAVIESYLRASELGSCVIKLNHNLYFFAISL
jgi:hypothetical protein